MAYDRYQHLEPLNVGEVFCPKGVMIIGGGTADFKRFKNPNYQTGVTGYGVAGLADGNVVTLTGTVQGTIFPARFHSLVRTDGGTTVFAIF